MSQRQWTNTQTGITCAQQGKLAETNNSNCELIKIWISSPHVSHRLKEWPMVSALKNLLLRYDLEKNKKKWIKLALCAREFQGPERLLGIVTEASWRLGLELSPIRWRLFKEAEEDVRRNPYTKQSVPGWECSRQAGKMVSNSLSWRRAHKARLSWERWWKQCLKKIIVFTECQMDCTGTTGGKETSQETMLAEK